MLLDEASKEKLTGAVQQADVFADSQSNFPGLSDCCTVLEVGSPSGCPELLEAEVGMWCDV